MDWTRCQDNNHCKLFRALQDHSVESIASQAQGGEDEGIQELSLVISRQNY